MPTPETPNDFQGIRDLQVELKSRGLILPTSMMPLKNEEATLFRFLRARKMDVPAAADMLQNTVQWRQQDKIEQTMETFLPDNKDNELRKHLPSGFLGFDKAGSPVWMEHAAAIDVPAMEAAGIGLEDFVYYHCRAMEYMIQCKYSEATEKAGRPVDNHCVILDLAGLRMNMLNSNTMKVFKSMSSVYQDHYPELMTRMFLVNIPFMFAAVWKVLQIFVDDRVKAKIRFLRKADLHTLHEFVDRDILPESLGGKVKGKVLSDSHGFLPPSLIAVNEEVQRRIDARRQAEAQQPNPSQQQQQPQEHDSQQQQQPKQQSGLQEHGQPDSAPATPTRHEADLVGNISISSDSLPPEGVQPAFLLRPSSSNASLSSTGSTPVGRLQLGSIYPAALSDTELVKLGTNNAEQSHISHISQVGEVGDVGEIQAGGGVPLVLVSPQALQSAGAGQAGQADPHKQHKKSKRDRAKGLLSSFTGGHHRQEKAAQEDMERALQMLSEMRRTESTPNVEAEALKRNKGAGGPWMSFTRQQRPHKPRSGKKGSAAAVRKGSPLATVTSGDIALQPRASPDAPAHLLKADNGNAAELDQGSRHRHGNKWKPFCIGAPMVHDDSDVEQQLGAQNGEQKAVMFQTADLPAASAPGTLSQRLAHKLSAIPAYLKTTDDADSLRLASPEGSTLSAAGSSGSYSSLQGEVVGRFASAPVLIPLASGGQAAVLASAAGTSDDRPTLKASTTSKAGPPSSVSHSQPKRSVSLTNAPQLGTAADVHGGQRSRNGTGVSSQQSQHAQQNKTLLITKQANSTVLHRTTRHTARYLTRNWLFLLITTINVAAMVLVLNHRASTYQMQHE